MKKVTSRQNYRLYPTEGQKASLEMIFGSCRFVYNHFLETRSSAWKERKQSINGYATKLMLVGLKKEFSFLTEAPAQALQESVIDLDQAYERFFKKLARHPRFHKKKDSQSFRLPQPRFVIQKNTGKIFIPKFKTWVPFKLHRALTGDIGACTITRKKDDTYEISFVVHKTIPTPTKLTGDSIGIDMGIKHLVTFSDGTKISAPKPFIKNLKRLKRHSRSFSRMAKGGQNWIKKRKLLAKTHSRIARQRKDHLNKLSKKIIDENQVISIENLAVKNMIRNPRLARSIQDLAWGSFISMLKYKAIWYGKSLRVIDRWYPSTKLCHECKYINHDITLKDRMWLCPNCKTKHDRDINAAINIETIGWDTPEYKPVTTKTLNRIGKKTTADGTTTGIVQVASKVCENRKKREPKASLIACSV